MANDRIQAAASAKFQNEIQGFTAADKTVSHAASLLQAADEGLAEIVVLAETVGDFTDPDIDNEEFSILDGIKLSA